MARTSKVKDGKVYKFRRITTDVEFNVKGKKEKSGLNYSQCIELFYKVIKLFALRGYKNQALAKGYRAMFHPETGHRVYVQFVEKGKNYTALPKHVSK